MSLKLRCNILVDMQCIELFSNLVRSARISKDGLQQGFSLVVALASLQMEVDNLF